MQKEIRLWQKVFALIKSLLYRFVFVEYLTIPISLLKNKLLLFL
jgi:hypothetical protein